MTLRRTRRAVALELHAELYPGPGLSVTNRLMVAVILLSVCSAILETEDQLYQAAAAAFGTFELIIVVLFSAEYLARVWTCPERPGHRSRLRYMTHPAMLIDLVVVLTMIFGLMGLEGTLLRLVRLLRVLRVAKLGKYSSALATLGAAVRDRGHELIVSLLIALLLLLVSSSALYVVEGGDQPEAFGSIPRAMWWSIATLTTVGYGDAVPVTPLGRIFAAVTALTGIGLIAMPAGILAAAFSDVMQRQAREKAQEIEESRDGL